MNVGHQALYIHEIVIFFSPHYILTHFSQKAERVLIHELHSEMTRLVKRYVCYILPARLIVDIPVREVSLGQEHQLKNKYLFIGAEARALLGEEELPSVSIT